MDNCPLEQQPIIETVLSPSPSYLFGKTSFCFNLAFFTYRLEDRIKQHTNVITLDALVFIH
jgi:hypothetical protein